MTQVSSRPARPATWYRTAVDPAFRRFLVDRLTEEVEAATRRRRSAAPAAVVVADRGLRALDDLLATLDRGLLPDRMSLDLLCVAYAGHAGFDPAWNRWLHP